jgi:signal transduction histidine kinase
MGMPPGYAVLIRDSTERRRVELLEEEGQRMTQFIATLSHELRNPRAPIRHALEALNRRKAEPNVQWAAEVIGRQVTHLTRLVDDLLDFSRVSSERMQLQLESLDLRDLLKATVQACTPFVRVHKHHVALNVGQDRIAVQGDPTRLAQVLTNVLNNAAKYTPAGGRIEVSLTSSSALAVLRITDTGAGMTQAMLRLAFEPFV